MDGLIKNKENPYHNSKYFDINDMLKMLNPLFIEFRILIKQPIRDNKVFTILQDIDKNDDGDFDYEEAWLPLPAELNPQKVGIAITYYRRYTLSSLLVMLAEDDDGNGAIPKTQSKPNQELAQKPQPQPQTGQVSNVIAGGGGNQTTRPKPTATKKWLDLWDPKQNMFTNEYLIIADRKIKGTITKAAVLKKYKLNKRDLKHLDNIFNPNGN
jgi:hypothetical protein